MGNKKNTRQRMPTAKKRAADSEEDSPPRRTSPRRISTRPKPRPTYKGAVDKVSDVINQTSKKAVKDRHVTLADSEDDTSMMIDEDAGEDEVIEEEEDEIWDDLNEEDDDVEVKEAIVSKGRQHKATTSAKKAANVFQIPFEVSVNGRYKELSVPYNATWEAAQILIGKKMLRDPETLSLGYTNPFKPRSTGKTVPSSLENEEEWNGLIQHVKTFLAREKAKNRGKGGMTKHWTIVLVDMGKDAGQLASKTNTAKGSKTKQFESKQDGNNTDINNDTSGSDSHTLAEICRRHHCDRCAKACYIDPGPPPVHKPFTMEQLSVWTSLVKLKAATIDQVPDALHLPKRRDREPLPSAAAASGPVPPITNTMTTAVNPTESQGYAPPASHHHPGFHMHGFPAPTFPIQTYPMPNYPIPAPMYAPPYGYPFAMPPQGVTQAMQPNGFPAPAFPMQTYPMLNYPPMSAPMYAAPSYGYPNSFAIPAPQLPQGANYDHGRKHQYSVSDQIVPDPLNEIDLGIPPSVASGDWPTGQDTPEP